MGDSAEDFEWSAALTPGNREVTVQILLSGEQHTTAKAGVLYYSFRDSAGTEVDPAPSAHRSKRYGWFEYVDIAVSSTSVAVHFPAPARAAQVLVGLANWKAPIRSFINAVNVAAQPASMESDFSMLGSDGVIAAGDLVLKYEVEASVTYELSWRYAAPTGAQALILMEFSDRRGVPVLPPGDMHFNAQLGAYVYVVGEPGSDRRNKVRIRVPPAATQIHIAGARWAADGVGFKERPVLEPLDHEAQSTSASIEQWTDGVVESSDVLVVHTTAGSIREGNNLLLRSNRIALALSRIGWKVLFVPFSGLEAPGARALVSENLLQILAQDLPQVVDALLAGQGRGRRVYLCSSRTDIVAIALQDRLADHGWETVYETRDDMEEFQRVGYARWYRPALEQRFASRADGIIATSPRLADRISVITGREDVVLIPNAAPDEFVDTARRLRGASGAVQGIPTVGYLGHLTASWLDWQAILEVMRRLPNVDFEFIGHGLPPDLDLPENARYLGAMAHEAALPIMSHWRVGLIPFVESRLTYGVDPNKLYEYLALGLQTVSAPMGAVEDAPGVRVYRGVDELERMLRAAVEEPCDPSFLSACDDYLEKATWSVRAKQVDGYLKGIGR